MSVAQKGETSIVGKTKCAGGESNPGLALGRGKY
jgi:hypothetical protein